MQTRNKMLDDISQLMTNAMGVAQGAREEAETAVKSVIDRWLADQDFVTREEFDALRTRHEALAARLAFLESAMASPAESVGKAATATKPASKAKLAAKKTGK